METQDIEAKLKVKSSAGVQPFLSLARVARFAAVAPHVFGILVVAGYWLSRFDQFLTVALYGGLACLCLVVCRLIAVIMYRIKWRAWTRPTLISLALLSLNFPASLLYAGGVLLTNGSARVIIINTTANPLTNITLEIGDQMWPRPNIPPGVKDSTTLFYREQSFNGVTLHARENGKPILRDTPESPLHRSTLHIFRI